MRTERRRRRSASLPCLSLLSPRDAIRIPIPSGPRCLRASALGPAVPPSVRPSVRRGLPVAVCRPPCCRHSLDGPIRVRWPRCPRPRAADAVACGVPPPRPPSSSSSSSPHSSSSSLSCIANEGFANVGFALARPQCHLRARGQTRLPREQSPLSQSQSWVAGRRRRRRGLASHSLTIWFCGSTSRAASPGHAARRALPVPHA